MEDWIWDDWEWHRLAALFIPEYKGYQPHIQEIPNGDGKVDTNKRWLHIAMKYNPPMWAMDLLARAHFQACLLADHLKVPHAFRPSPEDGTLRVLEYQPGAGSAKHLDFNLFTINCWRSAPTVRGGALKIKGHPSYQIGELGEYAGMGPASPHEVLPLPEVQRSIVYFSMPALDVVLPTGKTVAEWLTERKQRSRVKYTDQSSEARETS